jgi:sulfate permease, SulP family
VDDHFSLTCDDVFCDNDYCNAKPPQAAAALSSSTAVPPRPPWWTALAAAVSGPTSPPATVVLTVLLFFTRPLSFLPNSVLAAIVFLICIKLIDHRGLRDIQRAKPNEFALAIVTAATVVIFGVEQGIILAVVLSLLQHVRRSYRPQTGVVVRDAADHWCILDPLPVKLAEPGMVIFWFGADLFYANVAFFAEHAHMLVHASPTPVRWLTIDATAITGLDFSAGRALCELKQDLAKKGVTLALIVVPVRHQGMGLIELIGANHIF